MPKTTRQWAVALTLVVGCTPSSSEKLKVDSHTFFGPTYRNTGLVGGLTAHVLRVDIHHNRAFAPTGVAHLRIHLQDPVKIPGHRDDDGQLWLDTPILQIFGANEKWRGFWVRRCGVGSSPAVELAPGLHSLMASFSTADPWGACSGIGEMPGCTPQPERMLARIVTTYGLETEPFLLDLQPRSPE